MESCPFCQIVRGHDPEAIVVFEDDLTVAFAPLNPATRGHTLVVPKRHIGSIWEVGQEEAGAVMHTVAAVSESIRKTLRPQGINVVQSNGAIATQTVDHVHFHIVPRWRGDRFVLRWPKTAAEPRLRQRDTARALREGMRDRGPTTLPVPTPEDRRQHLSFTQSVVSRMASASASAKTWLLPIVTAAYGYAFIEESWPVAAGGMAAVAVFALLDANYLKQERAFRKLYDGVAAGEEIPLFSMNPTVAGAGGPKKNYWPDLEDWRSWSIAPFYIPMMFVGGVLVSYIVWSSCNS